MHAVLVDLDLEIRVGSGNKKKLRHAREAPIEGVPKKTFPGVGLTQVRGAAILEEQVYIISVATANSLQYRFLVDLRTVLKKKRGDVDEMRLAHKTNHAGGECRGVGTVTEEDGSGLEMTIEARVVHRRLIVDHLVDIFRMLIDQCHQPARIASRNSVDEAHEHGYCPDIADAAGCESGGISIVYVMYITMPCLSLYCYDGIASRERIALIRT